MRKTKHEDEQAYRAEEAETRLGDGSVHSALTRTSMEPESDSQNLYFKESAKAGYACNSSCEKAEADRSLEFFVLPASC